jgi:dipeptidyl aminopeptidase/acylaminoacyl peptidase
MGVIKYSTAEGKQLDAYITLPAGATKANPPPVVVMPYPWSDGRWNWQYDSQVQFLASRGYAVLQPNHRGAAGYTWMYPESEDWDLKAMSDDVAAATRKAIAMGLVDGKRVAILGGAFGGYLSAAAATFNPGLYKCCVSISAYYDWGRYLREENYSKFSNSIYSRYLHKLGDPKSNAAKFDAMSPLPHAGEFHGAALVVWGEYDNPESISQSRDFAAAVGKSNPSETLSYNDEALGVHHLGHEIDLYQHVEAFLAKNL